MNIMSTVNVIDIFRNTDVLLSQILKLQIWNANLFFLKIFKGKS